MISKTRTPCCGNQ